MAATIASLLADFSPKTGGEALGIGLLRAAKAAPDPVPEPVQPVVDRQAELLRTVEAKVRAEERESARLALEEALAAEKARFDREMQAERESWVDQQALQITTQLLEGLGRIEAFLSERVASILRPFVSDAMRQKTLEELEEALATVLSGGEARLLKICGPEDLLLSMKDRMGSHGDAIEFCPGGHVEVSVVARDTTLQTQLDSWSSRLKQALEG
jgi:hypothetical protein